MKMQYETKSLARAGKETAADFEGILFLPINYDKEDIFEMLDAHGVSYGIYLSREQEEPSFFWKGYEYFGIRGVERFLRYRKEEE